MNYRILTIDDDPTILRAYRDIHRREAGSPVDELLELGPAEGENEFQHPKEQIHFEVEISSSGEDGLQMVRQAVDEGNPYAVIYLDMRMPGRWNGLETAREIRSIDQCVRILVVTAYSEDVKALYEIIGDAFVYLKKPFVAEELIQLTRFLAQDWRRSRELQLKAQESSDLGEAKSEILAMISHELRTPLTTLMGNSELLAAMVQEGEQLELLQEVVKSAKKLQRRYDELFDAAQIQSRLIELSASPFDLGQLLSELETHFSPLAASAGLKFTLESPASMDHFVVGDRKRLQQVLNNLLANAFAFTRSGEVTLRITPLQPNDFQFVVEDTGRGMPAEMVGALSQPFSQLDMSNQRSHGGLGLGLYICRGLVSQMDGEIEWHSVVGQGTSVTLRIPLQQGIPLPSTPSRARRTGEQSGRFLLMDDAQELQSLLEHQFNELNVELVMASNGAEGIEKVLQEGPFDLLLIDLRMPKMDGIETTRALRQQQVTTPIIMLGADCTDEYRTAAKEAGAYSMLSKPLNPSVLKQLVALYAP